MRAFITHTHLPAPPFSLPAVGYSDGRDVVKSMVQGRKRKLTGAGVGLVNGVSASSPHDFLFEIVANKETGACAAALRRATSCRPARAMPSPPPLPYPRVTDPPLLSRRHCHHCHRTAGIDTDKFDYLYRDAHALALPRGFDYKRIMYR
jgi:hypothetical protein